MARSLRGAGLVVPTGCQVLRAQIRIRIDQPMKSILPLLVGTALCAGVAHAVTFEYTATLSGAAENPPNAGTGTGVGLFTLDGTTFTYDVSYSGLTAAPSAAHIHGPAGVEANAGVVFGILADGTLTASSGRYFGTAELTPTQVTQLNDGLWYVNIHNANFPGGAVRGQVTVVPEPSTMVLAVLGAGGLLWLRRRS